jgi:hypothetical protein
LEFCAAARLCSGKAASREEAITFCKNRPPTPPKEPRARRTRETCECSRKRMSKKEKVEAAFGEGNAE